MTTMTSSHGTFRYQVDVTLLSQKELDPIEAWLRLNIKGEWKMAFQGMMQSPKEGGASRLKVLFSFADLDDATCFKQRERVPAPKPDPEPHPQPHRKEATSPRRAVALPRRVSAPSALARKEEFLKSAAGPASGSGQVMASNVQLIGLDRIKAHFGDGWSRVAEHADQIAERAIQKRLTERDILSKVHDLNYLVLFAGVSQEEAQLRCRMIEAEITRQLIGDGSSGDLLTVKTGVMPVDDASYLADMSTLSEMVSRFAAKDAAPDAAKPAAAPPDPLANIEFIYRPMWDVKRKVVTSFHCLPALRQPSGHRVIGTDAIVGIECEEAKQALDFRLIEKVAADLSSAFAEGRKHLIAIPVHFDTISTFAGRVEYLNRLRSLPPAVMKLVLFEIVDPPDGVPQSRVLEISAALTARSRALIYRTSIWSSNWGDLTQARIAAVGADLSREHAPETSLIERFVKFAEAADKRKVSCYLHGVRSLSLTVAAVGAGFHYLSGPPIENLVDAPPDAHRFNLANLYDGMTANG